MDTGTLLAKPTRHP